MYNKRLVQLRAAAHDAAHAQFGAEYERTEKAIGLVEVRDEMSLTRGWKRRQSYYLSTMTWLFDCLFVIS